ncbi:MAG: tetratricopeptide repeat protein [Bacteroidia bacterium]|nr:tetratricopeptide repeat protein [Bacteroidia bacterium]
MKIKSALLLFCATLLMACEHQAPEVQSGSEALKADSLSIKLNSPELKQVNAELLKDPSSAALYDKRAKVYLSLKQLDEAVYDANRAIRLDSTNENYYLTLVDVYYGRNNTRKAKDLLEIIEKKFPSSVEAMLKLGELYFLVKQYQKGIDYVNKALKVDENLAKAYYIKGSIYRESGDTTKAISSLETAIEQDNSYEDAFYDLGILYAARKNPLAFEYYNNALKINPNNSNTRYAHAKLLQDLGKIDEAIKEYEDIQNTTKICDNCCYNLGAIFLEIKKDNKKAIEHFTKALELNPNYVAAYFARGLAYSRLNEKESARADYQMCLKLQPDHQEAADALSALR